MKHPFALLLLLAATSLAGCQSNRPTSLAPATVDRFSRLPYPADAAHGPDLDIVVTRSRDRVQLSNRTARTYRDIELWLNRQYVQPLDLVRIGNANSYPVTAFINRHREPLPTPAFLQPQAGAPIVLAEFYDPATRLRHRLLVQSIDTALTGVEGQE